MRKTTLDVVIKCTGCGHEETVEVPVAYEANRAGVSIWVDTHGAGRLQMRKHEQHATHHDVSWVEVGRL